MPTHSILTFEFDLMCYIEACVAAAGILFICLTGWLDPLFSPDQVSARSVLSWSCHGVASFVPERHPFLSFHSLANLLKKVNFSSPLPLVWNECSTSILHVLFSSCQPEFSGISPCFLSSSSPSASLGHHLTHLQLSLMVSAQKENYNSAPGRITPLSAPKPVPRVNKRVFV